MAQEESILAPDLRIDQSLIDYKKLKVQGVFPRKQRLPGDVFPTLAQLQAIGDDGDASALKATPAGSLHVTTDNASGGAPYKQGHSSTGGSGPGGYNDWQIFASSGGSDMGPVGPMNVLYGCQWSMILESVSAGTHYDQAALQLYPLPDQLIAVDLFSVPLAARSTDFGSSPASQHGSVNFGPGIDLASTFPNNSGFELWMHGGGNFHMWFVATFFYS